MTTPLACKLRWADDALSNLADEATQRVSWFGLDPNFMDSPGDIICDLLHPLENGFITDEALDFAPDVRAILIQIMDSITAYQREVGLDPDPTLTIDHPKWREIRALAKRVHEAIFAQQNAFLEHIALKHDILSIRDVAGCRLYSKQNALRLLEKAHDSSFGCLWIEECEERRDAELGRHMTGDWTTRGIKHLSAEWVNISLESAKRFLTEEPTGAVPSFWVYPWSFQNEEAAH
ncbi:hypothetical protein AB4Y85_11675 [Microvirga sp. 2YAF29]|uniref:hypothetical protein n=1 Tax=Microvirga sp. 2YAF29 TaxID=3233031 RepID=UPI003F9CF4BA